MSGSASLSPLRLAPESTPDWRLRVRLAPHEPVLGRKTQTGLMIESHLRAWLLQRYRRRLRDLRFAELGEIAEHKVVSGRNARLLERKR